MEEIGDFLVTLGPVFAMAFYALVIFVCVFALGAGAYGIARTRRQVKAERAARAHRPSYAEPTTNDHAHAHG